MGQRNARFATDDEELVIEFSAKADRDGTYTPSDIRVEAVTIFGVSVDVDDLGPKARKAMCDHAWDMDLKFGDEDHLDEWAA